MPFDGFKQWVICLLFYFQVRKYLIWKLHKIVLLGRRCRLFLQLSASGTQNSVMLFRRFCLLLCVALCHVSAQTTSNYLTRDDGCDRQVALIEQALEMLQTIDGRLESMDRRLTSLEQRLEKTNESEADHTNGRKGINSRCTVSKRDNVFIV